MSNASLILPCAALVLLTLSVALVMYSRRIAEMRARRISPQSIALSRDAAAKLEDTRAADNFRNLFELPVLFYALCIALVALGWANGWYVAGAWAFVALRVAHSVIHVGYNKVMHRFKVFSTGMFVLFALWLAFTVQLVLEVARAP
jgi:hypothetical protein